MHKLKYKEEVKRVVDYEDFDFLVERVYKQPYDFVFNMELNHDSTFSCSASKGVLNEDDQRVVDEFIETGGGEYLAHILLNDLCNKNFVEPGHYFIVS